MLLKKSKLGAIPLVVANINIDTDNISDDHGDKDESEDAGDISGWNLNFASIYIYIFLNFIIFFYVLYNIFLKNSLFTY